MLVKRNIGLLPIIGMPDLFSIVGMLHIDIHKRFRCSLYCLAGEFLLCNIVMSSIINRVKSRHCLCRGEYHLLGNDLLVGVVRTDTTPSFFLLRCILISADLFNCYPESVHNTAYVLRRLKTPCLKITRFSNLTWI